MRHLLGKAKQLFSSEKALRLLVVCLLGVALVLSYFVFRERGSVTRPAPALRTGAAPEPADARANLLKTPAPDAPLEDKQRHFELAVQLAKETDFLDITGCAPSPLVWKVKTGTTLTVENRDEAPHTIVFDAAHTYPVPRGTQKVEINFDKGLGLYGYGCDSSPSTVGFFLVAP